MEPRGTSLGEGDKKMNLKITLTYRPDGYVDCTSPIGEVSVPKDTFMKQLEDLNEALASLPVEGYIWPHGQIIHDSNTMGMWCCWFIQDLGSGRAKSWMVARGAGRVPVRDLYARLDQLKRQDESDCFCSPFEMYRGITPQSKVV